MADYKKAIPNILKWEGGFSDNPYDSGGATMKGVTLSTFRKFYGADKTVDDLKKITDKQWAHIFKQGYWNKIQGDSIADQSIANIFVDWVWMSGITTPNKTVQSLVGAKVDGVIGPKSIASINSCNGEILFKKIWDERKKFFLCLAEKRPANRVFLKGWLNRLNSYRYDDE